MRRRSQGTWVILVVLFVFMVAAFASIMEMRFSPGDIYPHYSTKRSDPLGARAFYESLERLPGIDVSRNLMSLQTIKGLDKDTTLLLLGLPRTELKWLRARDDSPVLEAVRKGTRLVIVVNPGFVPIVREEKEDDKDWFKRREEIKKKHDKNAIKRKSEEDGEEGGDDDEKEKDEKRDEPFLKHVQIDLMVPEEFKRPDEGWKVVRAAPGNEKTSDKTVSGFPEVFPNWYSQFRFEELGENWREVALIDDLPVVVERSYGRGRIVLTSDSYFASNEALWKGEDTALLWWLIGGKRKVVFDETIHGSKESGGIMKLIRRYRLHGFFVGLFVFLALLAWSSGSSLVPGSEEMERGLAASGGTVTGEDASSGMIRLLRRSIRPGELLDQCVEVWQEDEGRTAGRGAALNSSQQSEMDSLLQTRRDRPKELPLSDAYGKLVKILRNK